jgi:hypothetical protein
MDGTKTCICCGQEKHVTAFHAHKKMKDGRLNKCAPCVVSAIAVWRENNPEARAREYARGQGSVVVARGRRRRKDGEGYDAEKRKVSALKYFHKRRSQQLQTPVWDAEFDEFAIDEAVRLANARTNVTNFAWSVDHIVPMNHRQATGLHNAFNLNVAPAVWNSSKANRHMRRYFGE